jgi:hypothetical protein
MIVAPPEKSGAGIADIISKSGSLIKAAVASQTSFRLKEQILEAIPTAIPVLAFTRTDGYDAGRSVGSFIVLS